MDFEQILEWIVGFVCFGVFPFLMIGAPIYLLAKAFESVSNDRKQADYWREKWAQADDAADTLLRHSDAPYGPAETLLRPSRDVTQTEASQLLRAGNKQE